jgi:hypothetical protein
LPPLIIPRKSILLPPLISLPVHADLPSHVSSRTVNQPREEMPCLCRQSFHPQLVEVAFVTANNHTKKKHCFAAVDQSALAR